MTPEGWVSLSCWQNPCGQLQRAVGLEMDVASPMSCPLARESLQGVGGRRHWGAPKGAMG